MIAFHLIITTCCRYSEGFSLKRTIPTDCGSVTLLRFIFCRQDRRVVMCCRYATVVPSSPYIEASFTFVYFMNGNVKNLISQNNTHCIRHIFRPDILGLPKFLIPAKRPAPRPIEPNGPSALVVLLINSSIVFSPLIVLITKFEFSTLETMLLNVLFNLFNEPSQLFADFDASSSIDPAPLE